MQTQVTERQELHRVIDMLPDENVIITLDFLRNLRKEQPNVETREAIAELRAGKGKKFSSVEALMADLHDERNS